MENLAYKMTDSHPVLEYGQVLSEVERLFMVENGFGRIKAVQAASCLLKPEKGDRVLLALAPTGESHILAVLERASGPDSERRIIFDGPVHIEGRDDLRLTAAQDLTLSSANKLTAASESLEVNTAFGLARFKKFTYIGRMLHGQVERVKMIGQSLDLVFRRVVQRLTASYRYVAEHEEVQAASTRWLVDGTMIMHSRNSIIKSEKHVKVEAEQIHLG
ncbi:MAG: DUF3540 domain-containing protein [Thermodesulfobacteriota bacterium]